MLDPLADLSDALLGIADPATVTAAELARRAVRIRRLEAVCRRLEAQVRRTLATGSQLEVLLRRSLRRNLTLRSQLDQSEAKVKELEGR